VQNLGPQTLPSLFVIPYPPSRRPWSLFFFYLYETPCDCSFRFLASSGYLASGLRVFGLFFPRRFQLPLWHHYLPFFQHPPPQQNSHILEDFRYPHLSLLVQTMTSFPFRSSKSRRGGARPFLPIPPLRFMPDVRQPTLSPGFSKTFFCIGLNAVPHWCLRKKVRTFHLPLFFRPIRIGRGFCRDCVPPDLNNCFSLLLLRVAPAPRPFSPFFFFSIAVYNLFPPMSDLLDTSTFCPLFVRD